MKIRPPKPGEKTVGQMIIESQQYWAEQERQNPTPKFTTPQIIALRMMLMNQGGEDDKV